MSPRDLAARAAPYALLVAAALAATWRLFAAPGMPYNVDISGFFPLSPEAYEGRFWPLWNEGGGMSTLQFLPAILFELPLLVVGNLFAWDMAIHIKVRILLGFTLAGCSMYALARYYVERHAHGRLGAWALAVIPLAPALFFMFNPWSVHRVFHYFLWLGYALAPLLILAFERLADAPSRRRALVFALLAAIATTDPHNPPHFALLLAPFAVLRFLGAWRTSGAEALRLTRHVALAGGAYLLLAAYWILPYVVSLRANPGLGPTYVMSDQMLGILSQNGSFLDALRMMHNYHPRASFAPAGGFALAAWNVASYAIPLGAFAAALLVRNARVWLFAAMGAACVVLGMGSNPPAGGVYHWLLFSAPWGEGLSWLFRDPFRWGGFQAIAYAALLTFLLAELSILAQRAPASIRAGLHPAAPSAALALAALFVLPGVTAYMGEVYDPVVVPAEYQEANAFLATTPEDEGVVWMPRMLGGTTWSGDKTMAYFDATSSARAAMGPFRPATSTYFRFLEDATRDGAPMPPLLARAGAERIVYHNDRAPERGATTLATLERLGLTEEARFGNSSVQVVDQSAMAFADTPATRVALNGTLEIVQTFVPDHRTPRALTLRATTIGDAGPLEISLLTENGTNIAVRRAATHDDGAVRAPLGGLAFEPGATYQLRVRAPDAPNGTRWAVSCYTVDTYPQGSVLPGPNGKPRCTGDLAFELQATARGFVTTLKSADDAPRVRASSGAIASPGGLEILRALSALPQNATMAETGVLFTSASESARRAFQQEYAWTWVGALDDTPWEPVIPFLPADAFVAPFAHTTNADGKAGWARGTRDFTYYEYGWTTSLSALKQESWDFDADRGIVSTSANATLDVPTPASSRADDALVLARVYAHPKGGHLRIEAVSDGGATFVGNASTRDATAGFRWVEMGSAPAGTRALRLVGDGSFLGVNQLAVASPEALAEARKASDARFARTPVTLLAQAESVPALATRAVALPGVGRLAALNETSDVALTVPAADEYALWLRLAKGSPLPNATIDGAPLGSLACVADCDAEAAWFALPATRLAKGAHALTLSPPHPGARVILDALALTSAPGGLLAGPAPVPVEWTRVDATRYEARLRADGPVMIVLAQPHDAGWIARAADGRVVRAVPVDGVANAFLLEAHGDATFVLEYEPQPWAARGAAMAALALIAVLGLLAYDARPKARPRHPAPQAEETS